ncbi:hypothetical protein R5R35_014352 [Gryllus longicercus]|uniref:Tudor domain-containing protein 1 n=1 Tax=Gryllus longicercus TaxID=2509291 RepID=A0AAN9VPH3_9ORTH
MSRSSYKPMDKHWDPMQEAYRDPHFNSYKDGPGANLDLDKQPCSLGTSKEKTMFKLYVGNVPSDIDKDGIENIFRTVGEPIDVMRAHLPNNFAFVTFRTLREADEARRQYDRRPPMNLKIEYARSRDEPVKKRLTDNFELPGVSENLAVKKPVENSKPRYRGPVWEMTLGKGRGLAVAPFEDPRTVRPGNTRETSDIRQFQQYGGSNYDESNTAILKGVQRENGPGGPKKFVMGRGCFDREMDKLCQPKKLEDVIDNLHEAKTSIETYFQRRNGTLEFSKKEYPPKWEQGTCTLCKEPSTQYCAQCSDWYCSRTCQEKDWPRHRQYCGITSRKNQHDSANGANANQISPPRKGKVKGGRDFNFSQQNNGYTPQSVETIPSDTRYSKRKDEYYTKEHGACSDERQRSPQNKDAILTKVEKSNKKGNMNSSRNGSDESECSFEKDNNSCNDKHLLTNSNKPKFTKKGPENKFYNRNGKFDGNKTKYPKDNYNKNESSEKSHDINFPAPCSPKTESSGFTKGQASPPKDNRQKAANQTNTIKESPKRIAPEIFEENELLPDTFTNVSIQVVVDSDQYWVVLSSNMCAIASMSNAMESASTERAPVQLGAYCMARYQDMWFRAKITSVHPTLKVFFIDFGNEEIVTSEEIKILPDAVKKMPAQAVQIKLAPGTSQKYQMLKENEDLSVKRVHQNKDGIVIVHVEGEVYEHNSGVPTDEEDTPLALQNTTVLLKKGMKCTLCVTECNNAEFLACLVPVDMKHHYNDLFSQEFQEECERLPVISVVPKIGEAVIAKFSEEGWLRAYILHVSNKSEFTVASCDLGLVETVKEVKKLPPKCREIVQFAVECVILEENKSLDVSKLIGLVIESCSSDSAIAVLSGEECKIQIKKWEVPYELYEELKCVELKNGDCVISAEMSPFELYIRPLSSQCIDTYNRLLQDVAKYCFKSAPLKYTPKIGQVLAAKFTEDGNFYRAIVREVNKSKGVKVQYIDFGNVEFVNQEALKPLNNTLRSVECCVVKVVLENVVDRPLNEEVQKLFKDLILGTTPLKVKISEGNKVSLSLKDGTNLNEKINKMLMPGWKKGITDKKIYTINDVTIEKLECNSLLELAIIKVMNQDYEIIARPKRSQTIQVLQNDLQDIINEYCENTGPYTPREMELCVAKVDNNWSRALCFSGGNPLALYLFDTGVMVYLTHENIRKYSEDFTVVPAVGVHCKIKTKVTHSRQEDISRAVRRYLSTMRYITAKVIEESAEDSSLKGYVISVPELDEILTTL